MSRAADSAGIPFDGRHLSDHPFAGDDGTAPPRLAAALDTIRGALGRAVDDAIGQAAIGLVDALRGDRVLVPLVAEAGGLGKTSEGRVVEKTQELSIVTVRGPDGDAVGLMFSSVDQMATWRPDARPVPVEAARVAAWALTEDIRQVVLDPAHPTPVVCRRGMLWALVNDTAYTPPWEDEAVVSVLRAPERAADLPGLIRVSVHCGWVTSRGAGADILVRLALDEGLDRSQIDHITHELAAAWAHHPDALALVDGIRVELVSAAAP